MDLKALWEDYGIVGDLLVCLPVLLLLHHPAAPD